MKKLTATEFKAKCLAILDAVHEHGERVVITKRGRVVAALVPAANEDERPWLNVRGTARWKGDAFAPVIDERAIEALR